MTDPQPTRRRLWRWAAAGATAAAVAAPGRADAAPSIDRQVARILARPSTVTRRRLDALLTARLAPFAVTSNVQADQAALGQRLTGIDQQVGDLVGRVDRLPVDPTPAPGRPLDRLAGKLAFRHADAVIVLAGDSTGDETVEWFARFVGERLSAAYPWTPIDYATWNHDAGTYDFTTRAPADGDLYADVSPGRVRAFNASRAGQRLAYQLERLPAMLPVAPDVVIVSSVHNYWGVPVDVYIDAVREFVAAVHQLHPGAPIVLASQNPQTAPQSPADRAAHRDRCIALRQLAAAEGYGYLPVFEAFTAANDARLVRDDGVHPTAASSYDGLTDPHNGQYLAMTTAADLLRSAGIRVDRAT